MINFIKKHVGVIITVAVSLLICAGLIFMEDDVNKASNFPVTRLICDGTFITAVIFVSIGGLLFISQHGGFDALNYAIVKMKDAILHPRRMDRSDNDTYYDYVQSKRNKKKAPYLHFLIIGLIYFIVAIVLVFFTPDVPLNY